MKFYLSAIAFIVTCLFSINGYSQYHFSKSRSLNNIAHNGESFRSFTFNGSWCWFSDPRAIYYKGEHSRTYSGWIDNYGNVVVGCYDHETKQIDTQVLMEELEIDDHDNPSLLFDEEGKLMVFFNRHGYGDTPTPKPIFFTKSSLAEDIHSWSKVDSLYLNDPKDNTKGASFTHTYTNPIKLKKEQDKIFLFWRGIDGKPGMSTSSNNGETWALGKILFMPDPIYKFRRPYTKVYSNGDKKIHFTFTDGHPRNEKYNSLYYCYYEGGKFYKADGTFIKDVASLPLLPSELDKAYDGKQGGAKSWNWDIAEDEKGFPVLAYTKYPTDRDHIYSYARWNGKKWSNHDLINSGRWFPQTPKGKSEMEPNYSGGMSIDHEDVNTMYLSVARDSIFEIESWTTKNNGKSWTVKEITNNSTKDNVRPFAVRGAEKGNPVQVLWMQNTKYIQYSYASWTKLKWSDRYHSSIKISEQSPSITNPLDPKQIEDVMRQVIDWQLANPYNLDRILEWHWAAYLMGMQEFYDLTEEDRYLQEMINIGKHVDWKTRDKILYADNMAILSNWTYLYEKLKDPKVIEQGKWAMDVHLATRPYYRANLKFAGNQAFDEWWTWCDALFMGPPAFTRMWKVTGEKKYLDYMDRMWWMTADYLYSKEDSLMYRDDRYFDAKSDNDTKIFWGRGNGWVIGSLTQILDMLPIDHPSRPKYEKIFSEMLMKILAIQSEDGLWRASLLDPELLDKGESSGSGFFIYGLAYALNNGLIDRKYKSQVEKAWISLCAYINENGRLGGVQPEGIDPKPFTEENWHVYGTGAFLLAGTEMYKLESEQVVEVSKIENR